MKEKVVRVCLEIGPQSTGAFLPNYPGCWVFAKTSARALQKARSALDDWHQWMYRHGGKFPALDPGTEIGEEEILRVNYNPAQAGKPEPLFWCEIQPVERVDISRTLQLMGYAREDLLRQVAGLTPEVLDWVPPRHPRTIRNCLDHIARVEWWYLTRLEVDLSEDLPEDVFELLRITREMVRQGLEAFSPEKYRGIFQPETYLDPLGSICNLWTARKVLRRLVDHERLHTRYIEKILSLFHQMEGHNGEETSTHR